MHPSSTGAARRHAALFALALACAATTASAQSPTPCGTAVSGHVFSLSLNDSAALATGAERAAATARRVVTVPASPDGGTLEIRIVPDASGPRAFGKPHTVGRIEIARPGAAEPSQSIAVRSCGDAAMLRGNTHVVDVNFDGRPDLVTLAEFGAAWARFDVFIQDPASGRFVRNALARDLGRLRASALEFDPAARTIRACRAAAVPAGGPDTYVIAGGRLVPVAPR